MKSKLTRWIMAALAMPLLATCAVNGCTAEALRVAASELSDVADDMDGSDKDADLGDFLSDLVEDL